MRQAWELDDAAKAERLIRNLAQRWRSMLPVIVANSEVSSVRDSDRIIGFFDSKTVKAGKGERMEKHLLITRFDAARAARGEMLAIEDVLDAW